MRHFLCSKCSRVLVRQVHVHLMSVAIQKLNKTFSALKRGNTEIKERDIGLGKGRSSIDAGALAVERKMARASSDVQNVRVIMEPCMMTLDEYLANKSKELYKLQIKANSAPAELDLSMQPIGTPKKIMFYNGDIHNPEVST